MTDDIINTARAKAREAASGYDLQETDLEDLMSVAALAALEAEPTFNDKMGASLATWCVGAAIFAARNWLKQREWSVVPLGRSLAEAWQHASIVRTKLAQELGREPRNRELADALGMTLDQYELMRSKADYEQTSLDELGMDDDDESLSFEELLPGSPWEEPEAFTVMQQQRDMATVMDRVHEQLGLMNEREREVVVRYFGLGGNAQTQAEIAVALEVDQATVHRTLYRALENLRGRLTLMGIVFEDIRVA